MTVKYLGGSNRYLQLSFDCENEIEVARFNFINQYFDDCFDFKMKFDYPYLVQVDNLAEYEDIKAIYKIAVKHFKNKNSVMEFYSSKIKETNEEFIIECDKTKDYDILLNLSKIYNEITYQLQKEQIQYSNLFDC